MESKGLVRDIMRLTLLRTWEYRRQWVGVGGRLVLVRMCTGVGGTEKKGNNTNEPFRCWD